MYKEETDNRRLLNEYLASRHENPKPKKLEEFSCNDCRTNVAIDFLVKYEQQRTRSFNYVPTKAKRLMSAGVTFTKDSVLFKAHENHKTEETHKWFMTQPKIQVGIPTF